MRCRDFVSAALSLGLLTAASFAATNPLNNPHGIAVDVAGNLWVANTSGGAGDGNILVFSPGYVLQKSRTITLNINLPTAVAFDPDGNLWVANYGVSNGGVYGSVAQYSNGVQIGAPITNGINGPLAIAIDGADDLYVNNSLANLTIYTPNAVLDPPSVLTQTVTPGASLGPIAIEGDVVTFVNGSSLQFELLLPFVETGAGDGGHLPLQLGISATTAGGGNVYLTLSGGQLYQINSAGGLHQLTTFPFAPTAMALDLARGRLYASSAEGNAIYVYSMSNWALLKTIQ